MCESWPLDGAITPVGPHGPISRRWFGQLYSSKGRHKITWKPNAWVENREVYSVQLFFKHYMLFVCLWGMKCLHRCIWLGWCRFWLTKLKSSLCLCSLWTRSGYSLTFHCRVMQDVLNPSVTWYWHLYRFMQNSPIKCTHASQIKIPMINLGILTEKDEPIYLIISYSFKSLFW